jgi:hypothetical protein
MSVRSLTTDYDVLKKRALLYLEFYYTDEARISKLSRHYECKGFTLWLLCNDAKLSQQITSDFCLSALTNLTIKYY